MLLGILGRLRSSRRARRATAVLVLLAAAGVAAVLWSRREKPKPIPRGPMVGAKAKKIADEVEFWIGGGEVDLKECRGQPVLLYFWHYRDEKSLAALPHVIDLDGEFGSKGLITIGATCFTEASDPEDPDSLIRAAEALRSRHGIPFRLALDCDGDLHEHYGFLRRAIPYCFLIDVAGIVHWSGAPEHLTGDIVAVTLPRL